MADQRVRAASRRDLQLDAISTLLILSMVSVVGLLLYLLTSAGVQLPEWFPLAEYAPRILLGGFVVLVVLYLYDQRRRLRAEVERAWDEAEAAKSELASTVSWLQYAHNAASLFGAEGVAAAMQLVLQQAVDLYQADAAAVLGEDDEYSFIADGAPVGEAERALTHVALTAAGRPTPLHISSLGTEQGQAIAVPLRVLGDLRYVLCIWRREHPFTEQELDSLGLMGRTVELAMEREESLSEAQAQLEGTLRVLQFLVADKRPDYSRHAVGVAELAATIGQSMGLRAQTRRDLRLAGLIHDVGMMSLPGEIGDAGRPLSAEETLIIRQHPRIGAEIAEAANFNKVVRQAVGAHHERMDGSGYPLGIRASQTPLEARILAVCEVYDSMTHRTYHGEKRSADEAVAELKENAGVLYDARVVASLLEVLGQDGDDIVERCESQSESEATALAAAIVRER